MAIQSLGLLANTAFWGAILIIGGLVFLIFIAVFGFFALRYGKLWIQAYMSVADVSMPSLIRMHFTKVNPNVIVQAKVMSAQAGLDIGRKSGISTRRLEAHYLAAGNVMNVIHAIIAAARAEIPLDFDQASAIDLAG
ncbi:MAG: flotillin-like FloA family protein, partial [Planctomycetota bacterium]